MSRTRLSPIRLATCLALAAVCTGARGVAASPSPAATPTPALIRSARSGPWSAPSTWEGGRLPGPGARVQVRAGHTVQYDRNSDQAIRSIHLVGALSFARDRDTRLDVGLIKVQPGTDASENGFDCDGLHPPAPSPTRRGGDSARPTLEVGTAQQPIPAGHTARIRLVYFPGMDRQSCPGIVCCGGRMEFHGAPLSRTWVKLGATAKAGDSAVTLGEPVTGWRVGDHLILTATQREYRPRQTVGTLRLGLRQTGVFSPAVRAEPEGDEGPPVQAFTEERTIRTIAGTHVTLDRPLVYPHLGTGDYRGEVADLSRNVIVESAAPAGVRGHTMYHRGSAGSISYAEFRHLGKEGVLGRYSLHFHLVGNTMRGSSVIGASIWDSGNRWLTIHGTNYLVVRDCVGYQSVGHGFYLEDGTEVYNVLDRNLAVQAFKGRRLPKQNLPFDPNTGAGFWWANSLNTFTRNVACECDQYGFRFEATPSEQFDLHLAVQQPDGSAKPVDIRTLPFVRFESNEAHSEVWGLDLGEDIGGVGPDPRHPFVVRNLKVWNTHWAFEPESPSLIVDGLDVYNSRYGVYQPHYDHHAYRRLSFHRTDRPEANTVGARPEGLAFPGDESLDNNIRRARAVLTARLAKAAQTPGGAVLTAGEARKFQGILSTPPAKGGAARPEDGVVQKPAAGKLPEGVRIVPDPPRPRELVEEDGPALGPLSSAAFPQPLDPIDDLPPATVITFVGAPAHGKLVVRGTTSDNGAVQRVLVNGHEAKALAPNFAEWEVTLTTVRIGELKLRAHAEDAAGNVEKLPHELAVAVPR